MADDARKVRTAIVLQGGGARGAYELGVLKALYEERPGFKPSVVSGTSIGAITAAVLVGAKDDPIAALERLWRDKLALPPRSLAPLTAWWPPEALRSLAYLGNPGMYQVRPSWLYEPYLSTSVYETTPLRRTLADLVDPDKLNNLHETSVIVGAINVGTGRPEFFDNSEKDLTFEKIVASGSLPPGFPMTEVKGKHCWDGGLFTNLPLSPAINALEKCDHGDWSVVRELIVVELFPMKAEIPKTMPEVLDRMTQLQYTSRLVLDRHFFKKIGDMAELVREVAQELPADSTARDNPLFDEMLAHRKINGLVVTAHFAPELASARDFSPAAIEGRIQAGYEAAMAHGIGVVGGRVAA